MLTSRLKKKQVIFTSRTDNGSCRASINKANERDLTTVSTANAVLVGPSPFRDEPCRTDKDI